MVRVVVMVAAIAAFFSAAVLFGGNAVGAWDDANIPPDFRRALHPRPKEHRDASQPAKKAKPKRHSQSAEERWVARVERLCARATADTILLPAPQSEREALAYLERLARMNARYNGAFARLDPPPGVAPEASRLVASFRRDEELVERLLGAVKAKDAFRVRALATELERTARVESKLFRAAGASGCDDDVLASLSGQY